MLIWLGKIKHMKAALNLIGFLLLNHPFEPNESDILISLNQPFLLLFFTAFHYGMIFAILDNSPRHLVVELIGISLSCLLT
jgi:hypothetical protein